MQMKLCTKSHWCQTTNTHRGLLLTSHTDLDSSQQPLQLAREQSMFSLLSLLSSPIILLIHGKVTLARFPLEAWTWKHRQQYCGHQRGRVITKVQSVRCTLSSVLRCELCPVPTVIGSPCTVPTDLAFSGACPLSHPGAMSGWQLPACCSLPRALQLYIAFLPDWNMLGQAQF